MAEVWAFGARNDAVVYEEVTQRVAALHGDPHTVPLAEALELLGRVAHGITAAGEPLVDEMPVWMRHSLVRVVGMPHSEVVRLTQDQAQAVWDEFIRAPKAQREFPK